MIEIKSHSPEQTETLAASIVSVLNPPCLIILSGELGSGKTCFVRGAVRGLGATCRVASPTFVLAKRYTYPGGHVFHVDAYRIDSLEEILDLGEEELVSDEAITFVEWGDRIKEALPFIAAVVEFETLGENERKLRVYSQDPEVEARLASAIAKLR